jgi:S-adenosyl methyltransferase
MHWLSSSRPDDSGPAAARVDTTVAHIARVYDYWLGGKDNFAVDRIAAERVIAAHPDIVRSARGNRAFLGRAVRHLVGEAGVRQFLDIGTGLPAANNTHEVAQGAAPECRVVYVDNDPVVLSHAKALLASGPEGATAYVDADLRDPEAILAAAAEVLDFSRPVAVMLVAILQHISDQDDPYGIVARLAASVPSELPGAVAPGPRHPGRGDGRDRGPDERAGRREGYPPHPGRGSAVLRRLRAGRAGSGASTAVAARVGPGSGQPHGPVVRGRAQELTARRRAHASATLKSRAGSSPP